MTLTRRAALAAGAGAAVAATAYTRPASAAAASYVIRHDQPRQTILGLGVEIQSDSIGSGNNGLPAATTSVPHDLVAAERTRMYRDLLKIRDDRGFRYLRLALGLYLRGLDAAQQQIVGRWPTQMSELAELVSASGIEGVSAEYWSPAPGWKNNGSFIGGTIASTDPGWLDRYGDAIVRDLQYLRDNGLPVKMFSLQNEPSIAGVAYSCCGYSNDQYHKAFKAVAPKVKAAFPDVFIHADAENGQRGRGGSLIKADPVALSYVGGWSFHRIGSDSNDQLHNDYTSDAAGKPVFSNEFEYQVPTSDWKMVNTAQSIMNWMTFQNAPTWFWLHALKPTYNAESSGYSLGYWRPYDDDDFSKFPGIAKGHWDYNPQNFNGIHGFVKYLPWNSVRYAVDEATVRSDQRIMAWKTPAGKLVFAFTNRSTSTVSYTIDTGSARVFQGQQYTPAARNTNLADKTGPVLTLSLSPTSLQFWIERV
ncbi:hypothetical protein [Dactylosporangium matsuzakiense]|uniref:O-glycosyl hydrolase n=1 Tax=Dactylosporangium matsuzakiense TaxID=53360 RepID=A0A9W6KS30_9ACTN|nr:hypothetical protein [Dactylosporangium matsuzakiense]UWZ48352.1 hypothetical protein Dmats_19245 [Dactylosporangium matsuzakiense]GLL05496.1 hypothetical protein GCM10017581_072430 [Dactylosporangium matsuzakiense]